MNEKKLTGAVVRVNGDLKKLGSLVDLKTFDATDADAYIEEDCPLCPSDGTYCRCCGGEIKGTMGRW